MSDAEGTFHTYIVDWTAERIEWILDGKTIRTLTYADANPTQGYPQTPMQIKLGTWVGGSSTAAKGTVEWAGGLANFTDAPFKAYYQKVVVKDYMGGNSSASEYTYTDKTGAWQSIKVTPADDSSSSSSSASSTSSATKSDSDSKTKTSSASSHDSTASGSSTMATVTGSSTAKTSEAAAAKTSDAAAAKSSDAKSSSSGNSTTSASASSSSTVTSSGVKTFISTSLFAGAAALAMSLAL